MHILTFNVWKHEFPSQIWTFYHFGMCLVSPIYSTVNNIRSVKSRVLVNSESKIHAQIPCDILYFAEYTDYMYVEISNLTFIKKICFSTTIFVPLIRPLLQ